MTTETSDFLFSYGSLQNEAVQLDTFGRKLEGEPDALPGYRLAKIAVQDAAASPTGENYYWNAIFTGHHSEDVEGMVFKVTGQELAQADLYEQSAEYNRICVQLESGIQAWVYVNAGANEI